MEEGWVRGLKVDEPDGYHEVIRGLKLDLKEGGEDLDGIIGNDGSKQYRLSVPPGSITVGAETTGQSLRGHVRLVSVLEGGRRESA